MKFKIKGTKTTVSPNTLAVSKEYAARPERYEPVDAEAKALANKVLGAAEKPETADVKEAPKTKDKEKVDKNAADSGDE